MTAAGDVTITSSMAEVVVTVAPSGPLAAVVTVTDNLTGETQVLGPPDTITVAQDLTGNVGTAGDNGTGGV